MSAFNANAIMQQKRPSQQRLKIHKDLATPAMVQSKEFTNDIMIAATGLAKEVFNHQIINHHQIN